MKTYINIIYLIIFSSLFISCDNNKDSLNKMSNKEFIKFIDSDKNNRKGIERIDSIMNLPYKMDIHKKGLLHYTKAENLFNLEQFDIAKLEYNKALKLYTNENNRISIGITYNRLGVISTLTGNYTEASEQINKALKIFIEKKDKYNELVALDSKAHLAYSQKDYKKAITIIEDVLEINIKKKDTSYISGNYTNLGYLAELVNDNKKAEIYYKKGVKLVRLSNSKKNTTALTNLADFYYSKKKFKKSEELCLEALKIEEEKENLLKQIEIYKTLVDSIGNKTQSRLLIKHIVKRDSINLLIIENKNAEKIKLVENQYELIAKEKELIQEQKDQFNNKILFLISTISLLILGLFLYQKNKNSKLQLIQEKLILEQKVLRSQMNPHFIFNTLTSIQKNLLVDGLLKSSTSLSRFAKFIRQNFEFTNKNFITLEEDLDALKNYIETQQMRFDDKFDYEINVSDNMDLSYIKIPPMLLQPFVENAIEHGLKSKKEKGNLTVNILENYNKICFEIIDDGIGYKKSTKLNDREHATDVFLNRLKLRNLGEEKSFNITPLQTNGKGTKVTFGLKL